MNKNPVNVLKVVGFALGVAVVVLNILGTATTSTILTLLGLGLTAAAFAQVVEKQI